MINQQFFIGVCSHYHGVVCNRDGREVVSESAAPSNSSHASDSRNSLGRSVPRSAVVASGVGERIRAV